MESVAGPSLVVVSERAKQRDVNALTARIACVAALGLALLIGTAPFATETALVPFSLDLAARLVVCLSGVALAGHPAFDVRAGHVSVLLRVFSLGMCAAFLVYWVLPLDWLEEDIAGHSAIRLSTASALCDGVFCFALFEALHVLFTRKGLQAVAHGGAVLAALALVVNIASVTLSDRAHDSFAPVAALLMMLTMGVAIALLIALAATVHAATVPVATVEPGPVQAGLRSVHEAVHEVHAA